MRISDWSSDVCSSDLFPLIGNLKANDRTHQHRFARARSADHTQNLSPAHVEIQMFMHDLIAKTVAQAAHTDRDIIILHSLSAPFPVDSDLFFFRHTQPIQVNKTAKKKSSTITRKIDCPTAGVVSRPTYSAFTSTCLLW